MKKRNVYAAATLRSRSTSCLLGSDNSVYLAHSCRRSTHICLHIFNDIMEWRQTSDIRKRYSQFRFAPLRITWRGDLRRYTPFRYAELRITADIQNFFPQTLRDLLQEALDYPRHVS